MIESRSRRQKRWLGVLLLALQLGGWSAAALHAAAMDGLPMPDHVETPGSHPAAHDDAACPACRYLDQRSAAAVAAAAVGSGAVYGSCNAPPARPEISSRPRLDSAAPRAPPAQ